MSIPDEKIIAYVDGELDAEGRAEVEAAAAADPGVAAALRRHQALRRRVAEAHAGALEEPVPAGLEALIRAGGPVRERPAEVVDLAARRAQRAKAQPAAPARSWALLAAGFAAGALVVGLFANRPMALYAPHAGELVAEGRLAGALDRELASDPRATSGAIRVGLSFKTRDGRYCRTFAADAGRASARSLAGLACRQGRDWVLRTAVFDAAGAGSGAGAYRTAGSTTPAPVMASVQDLIQGEPLDAKGEAEARARNWR